MTTDQGPNNDAKLHATFGWIDDYFKPENKTMYDFSDPEQEAIFDKLSRQWLKPGIIEILHELDNRSERKLAEVLNIIVAAHMRLLWAAISAAEKSHTTDDLVRLLWEPLKGIMEYTMEKTDGGIQMHCTSCALADTAKEIGAAKWLGALICGGDPHIVDAFNPQIGLTITKTIMNGDSCCDHFYYMKKE